MCPVPFFRQVIRLSREAGAAGEYEALLHNMTISLVIACAAVCEMAAFSVIAHNTFLMAQSTVFQAVVSPGLVICGFLLLASSVAVATGTVHCWLVLRFLHAASFTPEKFNSRFCTFHFMRLRPSYQAAFSFPKRDHILFLIECCGLKL